MTILEEIKVKNVIIGKQFEGSKNYEDFIEIVKDKKVKVYSVEAGRRLRIDSKVYLDILWPSSSKVITENVLNNNSLVAKLVCKDLSVLFTGDIEEIAEKAILEKYKDNDILKADILKVAHHGSKSSSTKEFLEAVRPKIALIGVRRKKHFRPPKRRRYREAKTD